MSPRARARARMEEGIEDKFVRWASVPLICLPMKDLVVNGMYLGAASSKNEKGFFDVRSTAGIFQKSTDQT